MEKGGGGGTHFSSQQNIFENLHIKIKLSRSCPHPLFFPEDVKTASEYKEINSKIDIIGIRIGLGLS